MKRAGEDDEAVSYLFMGVSQIYLVLLKSRQESQRSMAIGVTTLVINLLLNALFIFGLLGVPAMGTKGAAIATCIARAIELGVCLADMKRRKPVSICLRLEAVILPGVTIGENSIIGAGSVVTRDIPANVIAFGAPCRVHRAIEERDKEYYYRQYRVDAQV